METCDVLIIGGGPAGSSLARALKDTGLKVILVDKQQFPRDKTCAGWITPAVADALELDLDDYRRRHTLQPITGFRVGAINSDALEIHYGDIPVSYGIRRCELDHYLLQRSGAIIYEDYPVRKIGRTGTGWCVNDSIQTRLLVGAGGNFCPVARMLGAKPGKSEVAVRAQEIEFQMNRRQALTCPVDPAVPELYFCPDLKGYGWVFRKQDYLNIGLGREQDSGLRQHVSGFIRFLEDQQRIPANLPVKFQGHAYLLYAHARRPLYRNKLLLVGDAAGLAYTQSGEGIRPAVESGLIAAHVIRSSGKEFREEQLQHYQHYLEQRLGKRRDGPVTHRRLVPVSATRWLGHKLLRTKWFVREIVLGRWFLNRGQSPFPYSIIH